MMEVLLCSHTVNRSHGLSLHSVVTPVPGMLLSAQHQSYCRGARRHGKEAPTTRKLGCDDVGSWFEPAHVVDLILMHEQGRVVIWCVADTLLGGYASGP